MDIDFERLTSFKYYSENFLKIKTEPPASRVLPFKMNNVQARLDKVFERKLRKHQPIRIVVLKARREGVSTYIEGRLFHKVHTTPNTNAFIIAQDKDALSRIFDMSKLFYDCLPAELRPMKRYSSKKELLFENPNDKDRFLNPGLRSHIEVFSAGKADSVSRSGGYSCAHFSEVAFYDFPEELVTATVPSIPLVEGTMVIYESTANGRGTWFHDEWLAAKDGQSNFEPIFFSWLEFPDYMQLFNRKQEQEEIIDTLDAEEQTLIQKYHATLEQLNWRRIRLRDFGGDLDKFHQEYPVDDVEAFVSSGKSYFNRLKVRELLNKTSPPEGIGDCTQFGFVENKDGPLSIWHKPEPGYEYVIGVDVGGGTIDGDPSVMEVLRVPRGSPFILQCAEYRDWIDPVVLAGKAVQLGHYYNDAMLAPEINNHGMTTLNEIKNNYWNIYRWQYFDKFGKFYTDKLGWQTHMGTKPLLCDYASACINADVLVIHSEGLVDEMMSFIKNRSGTGEADEGCNDDRVMAFIIGLFCLAHSYEVSSVLKKLDVFTDHTIAEQVKEEKRIYEKFDHDESYIEPNDLTVDGRDRSWLNY